MSDKEKAAREYSDDYKTLVPIDRTWAQISDTITLVSRESFLAGAEWAEKSKWIKCSERLPEIDGVYIIYAPSMDKDCPLIMTVYYHESVGWSMLPQVWIDAITHWQPLPEAPKEEE